MPPHLGALIKNDLAPKTFLEGGSAQAIPVDWSKWDTERQVEWVNQNTDFDYLGSGKKLIEMDVAVVAYVKPAKSTHGNAILLGNGSVILVRDAVQADTIIAELKAGKNPPPSLAPLLAP